MPTTTYPLGSPFGTGIPATADEQPPGASFSRFIDGTGHYTLNPDTGRFTSMPPVRQRLFLALRHLKDSSPVTPDGIVYPKNVSKRTKNEIDSEVRRVCAQMTDVEKIMVVDRVELEPSSWAGRVNVVVVFTDLTTGDQDSITFPH